MRRRKCAHCEVSFKPTRMGQKACSLDCARMVAKAQLEKKARKLEKIRRMDAQPRSFWVKKAQQAFNDFIRWRDRDLGCCSCGTVTAGQYHCGHYLTTKAQPGIRFGDPSRPMQQRIAEANANKQCAQCNNFKSGALTDYRIRLLTKYGPETVDAIERDHPVIKWTIEELKEIRSHYKSRLKEGKDADREEGRRRQAAL